MCLRIPPLRLPSDLDLGKKEQHISRLLGTAGASQKILPSKRALYIHQQILTV